MSRRAPFPDVRDLIDGEPAWIIGTARATGPLLHAPLSGQPCIAHTTHARVWSRLDFGGALIDDLTVTEAAAFALHTEHGDVMVDAAHAVLDGPVQRFVPPYHPAMHALLAARDLAHLIGSTFADHRLIRPDEIVAVSGVAVREHAPTSGEHGYRDDTARFKLAGYAQRPLRITLPR